MAARAPGIERLWQLISDARHAVAHTFDVWGIGPTDDPGHKRAGYTRLKRSFGGQVKEYAGTCDLPIHAVKYSLHRAAKTFRAESSERRNARR